MNDSVMGGASPILGDITRRKRTEISLQAQVALAQLLVALARAANEAGTAEEAMRNCLALIYDHGRWAIGRLGIYGEQSDPGELPERSFWHTANASRYEEFMRVSLEARFYLPEGPFISRLMREKRPVWFSPMVSDDSRRRIAIAIKQGLRCAFGFPVVVRDKVVAVLEFFAEEEREPDTLLLENIISVGSQLARLVERSRAEAVRARLAAIVEQSNDAIISRALDGTVLSWNAGAERMLGYTAAEMMGQNLAVLIPKDVLERNTAMLQSSGTLAPFESVRSTKDGRKVHLLVSLSAIRDAAGNITAIAANYRDITERKHAEEWQRASEVRVRELLRRLDEIQEAERGRIAADLHDVLGQNLSALEIELERTRGAVSSGNGLEAAAAVDNMAQIIQNATSSVREAMAELRPALLDDYGVFVAIESYASRIERLTGLRVSVRGNAPEPRPPRKTELALFRIAQEALMNVAKHASASRVTVELSQVEDVLRLFVEDDGQGISGAPRASRETGGWGIDIMRERAEALGGRLRIESPGVGTRVIVEIPLGNSHHPG